MGTLKNKRVLVVGLARTGLAVARFLLGKGARVTITDCLSASELGSAVAEAEAMGCSLALGGHPKEVFCTSDLVIVSPGVALDLPELLEAKSNGIPVIGELELASGYLHLPIVAISGTNGKTTTTELAGDMLQRSGMRVFVGGNIGNPLINVLQREQSSEVAVVEVSSFQLDATHSFHPQVAVLLNISEDHLDRYDSFADYAASKCRLFANQTEEDIAVVPAEDPIMEAYCTIKSQRLCFGGSKRSAHAYLEQGRLCCRTNQGAIYSFDLSHWQLIGEHNRDNLLAAVLAAACVGAKPEAIQESIDMFRPLPHRLELIQQWRGVSFFNDSKATNVGSVVRSLESFTSPIILIAGGRDKHGTYAPLTTLVRQRVKMLVLLGEARFRLAKALGHLTSTVVVDNMGAAVRMAAGAASPGDVVLLSPACSSFDLYQNYADRGDHFRSLVGAITSTAFPESEESCCAWTVSGSNG